MVNYTGGDTWVPSLRTLKPRGKLLTCGATAGFETDNDMRFIWVRELQILGSNGYSKQNIATALEHVAAGRVHPVVSHRLPLSEAREAERLMEERQFLRKNRPGSLTLPRSAARRDQCGRQLLLQQLSVRLAGAGQRQFVHNHDAARMRISRTVGEAEGLQLLRPLPVASGCSTTAAAGTKPFTSCGIADHADVPDRRVREQQVFDLLRIDILAAATEHVVDAAEEIVE